MKFLCEKTSEYDKIEDSYYKAKKIVEKYFKGV